MNEGSFDQREAIFAPSPADPDVPPRGAPARPAPGVSGDCGALLGATQFDVVRGRRRGEAHAAFETRLRGTDDAPLARRRGGPLRLWERPARSTSCLRTSTDEATPVTPPLALWGDPIVVAREPTRLPYNVLWIVVDALRPDVVAALHDPEEDAAARGAAASARRAPSGSRRAHAVDRRAGRAGRSLHARVVGGGVDPTRNARDALRGAVDRARAGHDDLDPASPTRWRGTTRPIRRSCRSSCERAAR